MESLVTLERSSVGALENPYRLFPHGICRIAAQPFDALDQLRSTAAPAAWERLQAQEPRLSEARGRLEAELHRQVGLAAPAARAKWLDATRELRRRGRLPEKQLALVRSAADPPTFAALADWLRQNAEADALRAACADTYRHELRRTAQILVERSGEDDFLKGLVSSSPDTYREKRALDETPGRTPGRRLVHTLLRYFSRAAAKTSPFSTFASLAAVRWQPLSSSARSHLCALPGTAARSAPLLNKALYGVLCRAIRREPALQGGLGLCLNPTLRESPAGDFSLLLALEGQEKAVRLPGSAILRQLWELFGREGILPRRELSARLARIFDLQPADFEPRLERLIAAGILQIHTGVADHEPDWAPPLIAAFAAAPAPSEPAERVRRLLENLEHERALFPRVDAAGRQELLLRTRRHLEQSGLWSHPDAGAPGDAERLGLLRNPFFEDSFVDEPVVVDAERLRPAVDALGCWAAWLQRYSLQSCQHATMRAFFDRRFAGSRSAVAFLDFYRPFHAEVLVPLLKVERDPAAGSSDGNAEALKLPGLPRAMMAAALLRREIARRWSENLTAAQIPLDRADLAAIDREARPVAGGAAGTAPAVSTAVFVQLLPRGADWPLDGLVVDQQAVHAGLGRYFSRFLQGLDPRLTRDLAASLRARPDVRVAELGDDSAFSFNANLHPAVAPFEISYPASTTGLDPLRNLALADLVVEPDPRDGERLRLRHRPSALEVWPVDLGFLNVLRRPPLFRVLQLFSPVAAHRIFFPWRSGKAPVPDDAVVCRPRLVFEERLVLARRAWRVPAAVLRGVLAGLDGAAAFGALWRWRRQQGLPDQVFFAIEREHERPRVQGADDPAGLENGSGAERRFSHKPQYLDFASPLLVELLIELARAFPGALIFEEMLPSPAMMAERRGARHATELIVQLDRESP